jgi:hypothetical protein
LILKLISNMARGMLNIGYRPGGSPENQRESKMTQAQVTKPANKPAKGSTKPATKAANVKPANKPAKGSTKPAAAQQQQQQQQAPQQQETKPAETKLAFFIRDSARPGAGSRLFAYTMAWLQGSGLIDGGAIPRGQALKFAGQTAIQYHTTRTMRLVDTAGMISLAPGAANFFADRHHDAKERETYRTILTTGEPDGSLIKQAGAIGKLEA